MQKDNKAHHKPKIKLFLLIIFLKAQENLKAQEKAALAANDENITPQQRTQLLQAAEQNIFSDRSEKNTNKEWLKSMTGLGFLFEMFILLVHPIPYYDHLFHF